jgi:hypothetical protein
MDLIFHRPAFAAQSHEKAKRSVPETAFIPGE